VLVAASDTSQKYAYIEAIVRAYVCRQPNHEEPNRNTSIKHLVWRSSIKRTMDKGVSLGRIAHNVQKNKRLKLEKDKAVLLQLVKGL